MTVCEGGRDSPGFEVSAEYSEAIGPEFWITYGQSFHVQLPSGCLELGVRRQQTVPVSYAE